MGREKGNPVYTVNEYWTYEKYKKQFLIGQKKVFKYESKINRVAIFIILVSVLASLCIYKGHHWLVIIPGLCCLIGIGLLLFVPFYERRCVKTTWKSAPDTNGYDIKWEFFKKSFARTDSTGTLRFDYKRVLGMKEVSGFVYIIVVGDIPLTLQREECSDELIEFLKKNINMLK